MTDSSRGTFLKRAALARRPRHPPRSRRQRPPPRRLDRHRQPRHGGSATDVRSLAPLGDRRRRLRYLPGCPDQRPGQFLKCRPFGTYHPPHHARRSLLRVRSKLGGGERRLRKKALPISCRVDADRLACESGWQRSGKHKLAEYLHSEWCRNTGITDLLEELVGLGTASANEIVAAAKAATWDCPERLGS